MEKAAPEVYETQWGGRPLRVELGTFAGSANGSALIRYGETVVLATAVASALPRDADFFPLTTNYEERLYAVGKIPGGFIKREGRPSEKATLASRLIDRPLRPLFFESFRHEVQVVTMVLSVDQDCSSEMSALFGASMALSLSDIPFMGPLAGVIVGRVGGKFVINPTVGQMEDSDLQVVLAGTARGVNMVEAAAQEVPEEVVLEAIDFGYEVIKELVSFQEEIVGVVGLKKMDFQPRVLDGVLLQQVRDLVSQDLLGAIRTVERRKRHARMEQIRVTMKEYFESEWGGEVLRERWDELVAAKEEIIKEAVRRMIVEEGKRPDGRDLDAVRPLQSSVGILPRTHGSGTFRRGQTQVMSVCTLGALRDVQILDGLDLEESKRFMHHYNFPPFSVGEARSLRAPGRREIGHGALVEKALEPVVPSEEDFPYTIRVVSEVLESNGSSSQASVCAASLALMNGGVPIRSHVAGVAMGLVKEGDVVRVLTDIQGLEDHTGDMDFKVAGTRVGITALQMDIKIAGIDSGILRESLQQAKEARIHILDSMEKVIFEPNQKLSPYAPKILTLRIHPDKIRDVIGPSGRIIHRIIEETGVKIDIEQDGRVFIASPDPHKNERARKIIEDLVRDVEIGRIYTGIVKRVEKYGVFVEIFPGKEGLVHTSQLDVKRVDKVSDLVSVGDEFMVKVTGVDEQGRINLSRKAVLETGKGPSSPSKGGIRKRSGDSGRRKAPL
ncbi:polyribonucleotide nucleotidyltransferase [Pasteuria penetrans]|uniref:polyribonucleotide nucleotidyltransferase n=1 Tax=Pasteuria penetrans TaxID=86005 RepID=UPI0011ECF066|nr:polyribonucleotide nucleotidyltransferase [Pasteuria penetrans]